MRMLKTMLLGLGVPLAFVVAGVGQTASARPTDDVALSAPAPEAAAAIPIFPWPLTCEVVLCSPGTYCVDTPTGPTCVPFPDDDK